MSMTHTPGPWMVETSNSWRRIGTGSGGGNVCCPITQNDGHPDLYFKNGGPEGPDAHLITAAPDLLAALREMLNTHIAHHNHPAHAAARAAIAKATGEAP